MVMSKLSKIDAAVEQVDWAIRFFLDNQAYIPAITLAGAAEEILGRAVQGDPSYKVLKEGLAEMLGEDGKGIGEK